MKLLRFKLLLVWGLVALSVGPCSRTADAGPLRRVMSARSTCPSAPAFAPSVGVQYGVPGRPTPYQTIPPAGVPAIPPQGVVTMPQTGTLSFPQRPLMTATGNVVHAFGRIPCAAVQGVGQTFAAPRVCDALTGCR